MSVEMEAALAAVELALTLIGQRAGAEQITSKGGRDLVTQADVNVEDAVRAELRRQFPAYGVVGEERGDQGIGPGRPYWLVDPICGTRNFASGLPLYAVNLALVKDGRVTLAVLGDGVTGDRYAAARGAGAYVLAREGRRPLQASVASDTISLDVGAPDPGDHHRVAGAVARVVIAANRWFVRMLGTSLTQAHLAAGRFSALLNFKISHPLHAAAGCLLAEEAGAVVTDLTGRPWDLESADLLLAATPGLHAELLEVVRTARAT